MKQLQANINFILILKGPWNVISLPTIGIFYFQQFYRTTLI